MTGLQVRLQDRIRGSVQVLGRSGTARPFLPWRDRDEHRAETVERGRCRVGAGGLVRFGLVNQHSGAFLLRLLVTIGVEVALA